MEQTKPKRRIPWLKLALVVSLVLNVLVIGMLWGVMTRTTQQGSLLRSSVAALPAQDRRELRRATGAILREARRQSEGSAGAPQQMLTALRAEDFDPEAFSDALRQAQDRLLRISNQMHDQLLEKVSAMSLEERHAYAASLEDRIKTRPARNAPRTRD
ncbi:periplasmic heavy metal sensor [Roseinatronobacter sp.]|uniref:periplasmic heavy metal sensor n=1 Tax=Roseinatronobacter sp. TaxID=1945755 RepID=UPI0025E2C1F2|nr:periplasmic heavy metal sensor [Rhodobaca sp.]